MTVSVAVDLIVINCSTEVKGLSLGIISACLPGEVAGLIFAVDAGVGSVDIITVENSAVSSFES